MHKTEKTLLLLCLFALILKVFNVVLSDIIWVISLNILATFYFIFGLAVFNQIPLQRILNKESYKGISKRRMAASLAFGWVLPILCIGIMFKLLVLPGTMTLLFSGFSLAMIGLVSSSFLYKTEKKEFFQGIWTRLIPATGLAYLLANLSDELIKSLL